MCESNHGKICSVSDHEWSSIYEPMMCEDGRVTLLGAGLGWPVRWGSFCGGKIFSGWYRYILVVCRASTSFEHFSGTRAAVEIDFISAQNYKFAVLRQ